MLSREELRSAWHVAAANAADARDYLQWAEECGTLEQILDAADNVSAWCAEVDRAFRAFAGCE